MADPAPHARTFSAIDCSPRLRSEDRRRSRPLSSVAGLRPVRGAGQPDVRPDRRPLRRDELGDDRRPSPSLAPPGRRPRPAASPGDVALDVCCGTGDLGRRARPAGSPPSGHVIGCDFSEPMLDLAREKAAEQVGEGVRFEWADALELPYGSDQFDAVTVGFGVRNLADLDRGLSEMARVLKPGGPPGDPRDHQPDAGRPSRPSTRSGSTGWCRCWGSPPATATPTPTCPSRCAPFPRRWAWPRGWTPPGSARSATRSSPEGSSPSTAGCLP